MKRLGYTRFVAQGGDWGNAVTEQMALLAPPELIGIHTNMPAAVPDDIAKALAPAARRRPDSPPTSGTRGISSTSSTRMAWATRRRWRLRPQTLYALADSPVGLAAWMLDHDAASEALIARVFAGESEGLTRDDMLDNATLYWVTNTAVSSARLYWESKLAFFAPKGVAIPTGVSAFPDEIYTAPQSWTETGLPEPRSTTTACRRAATSRPGNSRSSSARSSARHSARCADPGSSP